MIIQSRKNFEIWTIRKTGCQRIDVFKLWCWRRLLRLPWKARRSNQSILKEINPEYSVGRTDAEAEAPILWPPDVKNWLIGKGPDAGKNEGKRRKGWQKMRWLDGITDLVDMSLSELREIVIYREAWCAAVHRVTKSRTQFSEWTTRPWKHKIIRKKNHWTMEERKSSDPIGPTGSLSLWGPFLITQKPHTHGPMDP